MSTEQKKSAFEQINGMNAQRKARTAMSLWRLGAQRAKAVETFQQLQQAVTVRIIPTIPKQNTFVLGAKWQRNAVYGTFRYTEENRSYAPQV